MALLCIFHRHKKPSHVPVGSVSNISNFALDAIMTALFTAQQEVEEETPIDVGTDEDFDFVLFDGAPY